MNDILEEKYAEYQQLISQFQNLQENNSTIDKHIKELHSLKENLSNLSQIKSNTESLTALGSGIFLKSSLKEIKNVVMNVGSNIYIEKTVEEAANTVDKQTLDITNVSAQLKEEMNNLIEIIKSLQTEINSLQNSKDIKRTE